MLNRSPIVALVIFFAVALSAPAQQAVPDAPQPQKKTAPKQEPATPADTPPDAPAPKSSPAKDDNAFPEAVSKAAADAAQEKTGPPDAPQQGTAGAKHSTAEDNPFPEAVSKAAAKAAGSEPAQQTPGKPQLPPGVSSSQSSSADDEAAGEVTPDPARSKKDTEVGRFYLTTGNLQGALTRFQDASASDPTNIDAIFGLAEAQRMLGKKADAVREYQMYLDIVPNGPRAKEAIKALKTLQAK
jgi:tetratricopeptide (TPR) repeat protein